MEKKLIWYDSERETWWKSRSNFENLSFILAEDKITNCMLVLLKNIGSQSHDVVAALPNSLENDQGDNVALAKVTASNWINSKELPKIASGVRKWLFIHSLKIFLREFPYPLFLFISTFFISFVMSVFFFQNNYSYEEIIFLSSSFCFFSGFFISWVMNNKLKIHVSKIKRNISLILSAASGTFVGIYLVSIVFFSS